MKIHSIDGNAQAATVDISGYTGRLARQPQQRDTVGALASLQNAINELSVRISDFERRIAASPYLTVLNRSGEVVAKIGVWGRYEGAFFRNVMIGPDPATPQIYQDASGDVFVDGDIIVDGTITASSFNINRPEVVGMAVTNNSPSGGRVAWASGTIVYAGTAYAVSSADTANMMIWWNVGDSTLSSGATFVPLAGRFLIFSNLAGIHDTAWNKNAASGIVRPNLNFNLLEGMALQPPVEVTPISLNPGVVPTETTVLNVTGSAGVLLVVQVEEVTGGGPNTAIATIRFTIDGATPQDYLLWNAANWPAKFTKLGHFPQTGNGSVAGDVWTTRCGIPFTTSCSVKIRVTTAHGGAHDITARAEYALKV